MQKRLLRAGDIVKVKGHTGTWKVTATRTTQGGGTRLTTTSLNAYPRIDLTVLASRATIATQE